MQRNPTRLRRTARRQEVLLEVCRCDGEVAVAEVPRDAGVEERADGCHGLRREVRDRARPRSASDARDLQGTTEAHAHHGLQQHARR